MDKHKSNSRIFPFARVLMSLALLVFTTQACAAEPVKIGVQAFRAKAQVLAQWQPLAVALKHAIPERDFIIEPLTNEEMGNAVATRQVDFVLTNPSNYVVISKRSGLSSPLATLADEDHGREVTVFGGIIFCRAGQEKISSLTDIAGKTIAATTIEALGSYQMQAYELSRAGVRLPQDAKVIFTGPAQDDVVAAVLSGRADVGFVRTGLLESMAREGKLDMAQLKIINRQNLPGYSAALSTHLYPNWPFSALPHIDENLARRVAVTLFSLEENVAFTRAMRIHGFVVPADYTPVEALLQELHLPPYDVTPEISLRDVWSQYHWWIVTGLVAAGLILLLGYGLWLSNYRLRAGIAERKLAEDKLLRMNERFTLASRAAALGIWDWDIQNNELLWDDGMYALYGVKRENFAGAYEAWLQGIHPDDRAASDEISKQAQRGECEYDAEFRVVWPDGSIHYLKAYGQFVRDAEGKPLRMTGVNYDITERKLAEEQVRRSEQELIEAQRIAHMGNWNLDLEQNVLTWSQEIYRIFEIDPEKFGASYEAFLNAIHPDDREKVNNAYTESLKSKQPYGIGHRLLMKDGRIKYVTEKCETYYAEDGRPLRSVGTVQDITESKQAEEALRREQMLMSRIMETSPVGIAVVNKRGQISFANPQAEKILGLNKEQITQLSYNAPEWHSAAIDGGPFADEEQPFSRVMATRLPVFDVQHAIVWPDGHRVLLSINGAPILDAQGEIEAVVFAIEDITRRRLAEEELRASERSLIEAQRIAHLGSWHMDLATNEVFWSEELYKIYGFDPALPPPLYTESMKLFTPESWERLSSSIARAAETGVSYELELETVSKDGGKGWMLALGELVRDARGAAVGVRGVVMDITERKRMEAKLVEREYQFRTLAENSPDVIVRYDRQGRRIYVNPEFERVNHLTAQQVIGKTPTELSTELKPKADEFTEKLMAAMASGRAVKVDLSWLKDGKRICWFVRVVPEFDAYGKVMSALTIWSDISERKQAEEEIRTLNRELEQRVAARTADLEAANKELEAFSYSVSHDLRTPLRAIDGFSGMLLEDYAGKLDEEGKRLLNVVRDNTIRMGQLIDDILKFSRTGRLEISFSEIDMEKLAREVGAELQPAAGGNLQVEIAAIPASSGDRSMLRQVFVNLLSNAIKFSRIREIAVIQVGGFIEGGEAIYFVKDNGVGFDMQYAGKLFGVFQRLHGMDEFEGTGIGLAIVKRIVARHGGRVWSEGKVGEGATFYFSLPQVANKEAIHG